MRLNLKKIFLALLVLAGFFSVVQSWLSTLNLNQGGAAIDAWEARLMPAKKALPIKRGVIGYVGEWDAPGISYAYWDQESEYLLAQYSLAPLILKKGAVEEWNVAVLSEPAFAAWQKANQGKFEIIPLKHNVYLFHRLANP
ncbi:MAG TPA: hypothetical protein VMT73_10055 [Anaerolineales bacterium]|nr:hypothetical protein [Anaerolineales bacterium]